MKERVYEQTPFLIYCSSEITQISRHAHSSPALIILLTSSVAYFNLCNPTDTSINKDLSAETIRKVLMVNMMKEL